MSFNLGVEYGAFRKTSGEIRMCIELWNLNRDFDKDNYTVPPMEQIPQLVFDFKIFFLLDGFLRYN